MKNATRWLFLLLLMGKEKKTYFIIPANHKITKMIQSIIRSQSLITKYVFHFMKKANLSVFLFSLCSYQIYQLG